MENRENFGASNSGIVLGKSREKYGKVWNRFMDEINRVLLALVTVFWTKPFMSHNLA